MFSVMDMLFQGAEAWGAQASDWGEAAVHSGHEAPRVSVVLPVHNGEAYLDQAIDPKVLETLQSTGMFSQVKALQFEV